MGECYIGLLFMSNERTACFPKKTDGDLTKLIPTALLLCHIFVDLVKISIVLKGDRLMWCRLIQVRP